jgi:LPXTG-motif cell wall-anchored protein
VNSTRSARLVVAAAAAVVGLAAAGLAAPSALAAPPDPVGLFKPDDKPANLTPANDNGPVNLGVRFTPAVDGTIVGLRFYKLDGNDGTHVGALWSDGGSSLAEVTFKDESATGWQMATFDKPVAVKAGTAYVASYLAPNGHYAFDKGFFDTKRENGDLSAPADVNGLFHYSSGSAFTEQKSNDHDNYWVDVLFQPEVKTPPTTAPATTAPASAPASTSAAAGGTGGTGGGLPVTGTDVALIAGGGVLLAVVGAVLFLAVRRRRDRVRFSA